MMKLFPIALLTVVSATAQAERTWNYNCRFENEIRASYVISEAGQSFAISEDGAKTIVNAHVHEDVFILSSDGTNGMVVTSISRTDIWEGKALATMTMHTHTTWSPKVHGGGCASK